MAPVPSHYDNPRLPQLIVPLPRPDEVREMPKSSFLLASENQLFWVTVKRD
jgi:hypothetical protein